jgi:hypothetical protein
MKISIERVAVIDPDPSIKVTDAVELLYKKHAYYLYGASRCNYPTALVAAGVLDMFDHNGQRKSIAVGWGWSEDEKRIDWKPVWRAASSDPTDGKCASWLGFFVQLVS